MTADKTRTAPSPPWHQQPGLIILALVGAALLVAAITLGGMLMPIAAFGLMLILLGALLAAGSGWRPTSSGLQRIDRGGRIGLVTLSVLALVGLLVLQAVGRPGGSLGRVVTADRGASSDQLVWVPAPVTERPTAPTPEAPSAETIPDSNDRPRAEATTSAVPAPSPTSVASQRSATAPQSARPGASSPTAASRSSAAAKARLAPGEVCVCDVTGTPDDGVRWASPPVARPDTTTIHNALGQHQRAERLSLTLDDGSRRDLSVSPQQPQRQTTLSLTQPSSYSLEAELTWVDGSRFSLRGGGWIDPRQARRWQVSLLQDGGLPYALRLDPLP